MDNTKGSRTTLRAVLSLRETLALQKIVSTTYTESKLDNKAFAEHINTTTPTGIFRFPINQHHITSMLLATDIPPNKPRSKPVQDACGEALGLTVRVQALEEQMQKLTAWLKTKGL